MVTVSTFKPLSDYVVVMIPKIEQKTKGGLIKSPAQMEQEFKDTPQLFKVRATGYKVEEVNVGQYVLCTRINRVPIESDDENFEVAVVRVFDIIGVSNAV